MLVAQVISDYRKVIPGRTAMSEVENESSKTISLTIEVVAAFVSNNSLAAAELSRR
jgi:hypothetical protein